jgi:phage terminase large subunit-like protein
LAAEKIGKTLDHAIDGYARDVVAGRVPAGKYHRLACVRHQRDRAREASPAFPYRFDAAAADRFFRFAARLKHYKGEWAGRPIVLQPYQRFRLGSIFGWRHTATGFRRFRTAYNEIPRKNGKSLEAAIVALYVTFFDGEAGAEGYCLATKREQAKIVFNDCKRLVLSSPELRARIAVLTANLHRDTTASKLEPLGADRDSTDGLNPNLIINDEFHAQKNRGMLDVMETATGARQQPLNFQITTAGNDAFTPCGDQHDYACKVLDGVLVDDTFFAFIAHADVDDDWTDDVVWRKANPNYGVSVKPDDLRALATKAIHMPAAAAAFKQKRLNIWVHTSAPWLSLDGWRRGQSVWSPDDMRGQPCYVGIDLSSKIDLTAIVAAFPPADGRPRWRLYSIALTPEDTIDARAHRDRAPYREWVSRGWLRMNPGSRIDQDVVADVVAELAALFDVKQIGVDPWNAGNLVKQLTAGGFDVIDIPQTLQQMSQPSKDFEADVLDGLIDGGGNDLLTWAIANAVVQSDNKDNIYPVKKKSRGRIDPLIAALLARKLATLEPPPPEPPPSYQFFVVGGSK